MKNAVLFLEAETALPRPGASRQTARQDKERSSQLPATALGPGAARAPTYVAVSGVQTQLLDASAGLQGAKPFPHRLWERAPMRKIQLAARTRPEGL